VPVIVIGDVPAGDVGIGQGRAEEGVGVGGLPDGAGDIETYAHDHILI